MCGIVGMAGHFDPEQLAIMTRSLTHRGPDGEGMVGSAAEGFGLGHRRLSIIDLSDAAAQPMTEPSRRYWITYNGEIYNYRSLRARLSALGHEFRTASDTEVLLHAYIEWGKDCLNRLNGIFAFAIWDRSKRRLFAARDHLGVKPLYWSSSGSRLYFASEIKALLVGKALEAQADPQAMVNPWHYPSSPRTGFVGIQKLPPATWLEWSDGEVSLARWWEIVHPLEFEESGSEGSRDEELAELLISAVDLQMISDVPIGAMLSGGLDSSLIVALMSKRTSSPVRSYTVAFDESDRRFEAMTSDASFARKVADFCRLDHTEITIKPQIVDLLATLVWHLDEPIADPASINTFLIAKAARDSGAIVLLSGMGADEIFGGYRKHAACLIAERYRRLLPSSARRVIERLALRIPVAGKTRGFRRRRWLRRFLSFASQGPIDSFLRSDLSLDPALHDRLFGRVAGTPYQQLDEVQDRKQKLECGGLSYLGRMCLSDTLVFLPDHNLTYTDKATMANGIEARPPLIDHRIVRLAFQLPDRERCHGLNQKIALRRAAARWLHQDILSRPKAAFGAPLRAWIRGGLQPLVREVLSTEAIKRRGAWDAEAVTEIIESDRSGNSDHSYLIWTLMSRELWHREFIDAGGRRSQEEARLKQEIKIGEIWDPAMEASW